MPTVLECQIDNQPRRSWGQFAENKSVNDWRLCAVPFAAQVSGSLQNLLESRPSIEPPDPYHCPQEIQASDLVILGSFSLLSRQVFEAKEVKNPPIHRIHIEDSTVKGGAFRYKPMPPAQPKIVASFIGRVEFLNEETANVLLVNEATGERLDSGCDAEVLRENGIGEGDQFRCEIVRAKGTVTTKLTRLLPRSLSKEKIDEICASHKNRWDF